MLNLSLLNVKIHPPTVPRSLAGDWTAHLKHASPAEREIERHARYLGDRGHLITSISAPDIASSGLVTERELRHILNPTKKYDFSFDNEIAVTNLFFSEKQKQFFKFKQIIKAPDPKTIQHFLSFLPIFAKIFQSLEKFLTICIRFEEKNDELAELRKEIRSWKEKNRSNIELKFAWGTKSFCLEPMRRSQRMEEEKLRLLLGTMLRSCGADEDCMLTLQRKNILLGRQKMDLVEDLAKIASSSDNHNGLISIPNGQDLIGKCAERETDKYGTLSCEAVRKYSGEIADFYDKVIKAMADKMRGTAVYSVSEKMLHSYIKMAKGHRYEFDWTLFTHNSVFFIEVSDAKHHNKVSLQKFKTVPATAYF